MSRRRRRREPPWVRIAAIAAAVIVAALLIWLILRGLLGALGVTRSGSAGARDPQFAEPADTVTRPPELLGEGGVVPEGEDPSAGWEQGEQTPVDKTAEELTREAEAAQ